MSKVEQVLFACLCIVAVLAGMLLTYARYQSTQITALEQRITALEARQDVAAENMNTVARILDRQTELLGQNAQ